LSILLFEWHVALGQIPITQEVDLRLTGTVSFHEMVDLLHERTGYKFAYGRAGDQGCPIILPNTIAPLEELLDRLFAPCHIQWTRIGKHIVLTPVLRKEDGWTLSGYVRDRDKNTPLEFASVYIPGSPFGTQTDSSGYFSISGIDRRQVTLHVQLIGYHPVTQRIRLPRKQGDQLVFRLKSHIIPLNAAISQYDRLADQMTISHITLNQNDLQGHLNISDDPLKDVSQLPAVAGTGDLLASDQLYIRGGEPEENLLLLDNVRFLWPYYIGGASVFNPDVIEKVEVMAGQFKTKYGQAMSGIINLTTRNGSTDHFKASLGLSAFHSSFTLEGPFKKKRSSYLIAYRKTNRFPFTEIKTTPPQTNDFTFKFFFRIGKNHRISYSNISVVDRFDLTHIRLGTDSFPIPVVSNNKINGQSLQWQSTYLGSIYNKLSVHTSGQKINYNYVDSVYPTLIKLDNGHLSLRNDMSIYIDDHNKYETGFEINIDDLRGETKGMYQATDIDIRDSSKLYMERKINAGKLYLAGYSHFEHQFNKHFSSSLGLRTDISNNKYIITFSPRWAASYVYNPKVRFTGFAGLFRQDPDLSYGDSLRGFLPGQVWQFNLGAQYHKDRTTNFWTEVYYKHYQHLVVLNEHFSFDNSGKGEVIGLELFGQYTRGLSVFRLSYSLSKAWRKRFLQRALYRFHFDQRHRLNIYLNYRRPGKGYSILPRTYVLNYRWSSGTPYTSVLGYEMVGQKLLPEFSGINAHINPFYQLMNAKLVWNFLPFKKLKVDFFIEFWNLFNAKNISERSYKPDPSDPTHALEILRYHEGILPNVGLKVWWN